MTSRVTAPRRTRETPDALEDLARAYGVETRAGGAGAGALPVDREPLLAVLRSMGAPVEAPADASAALRSFELERADWGTPPCAVAWAGRLHPVDVVAPAESPALTWTLTTDAGGLHEGRVPEDAMFGVEIGGVPFSHATVAIDGTLPPGFHELSVTDGEGWSRRSTVVSAPPRAWNGGATRRRGVFTPLYALHSHLSWGGGSFGDFGDLGAWVAGLGGNAVATLPLLAAFLGETGGTCEPSPYAPVSRRFWNELYLDVEAVPEVESSRRAQRELAGIRGELETLRAQPLVDHRRQARLQRRVIEVACDELHASDTTRARAHRRHLEDEPDVVDYARFRAAGERHGTDWRRWPARMRDGSIDDADIDPAAVRYHAYVQWLCHEQIERLRRTFRTQDVELHLDLPIGAHPEGFDSWRDPSLFADGVGTGAPPDGFFPGGQNWGFPPLRPLRSREQGHGYLRACLAHHMGPADALRIDHVMALHRLYWIPDGLPATDGLYVRYPADELYAVISLLSHRLRCRVVGEDLGTVPDGVRESMHDHGVARTWVAQFAFRDADPALDDPPPEAVATVDTHDTPTFADHWNAGDLRRRVEMGWITAEAAEDERAGRRAVQEHVVRFLRSGGWMPQQAPAGAGDVLTGLLAFLGASRAGTALANLEDLWLETEPQNMPGTGEDENPNWRRKARHDIEALSGFSDAKARMRALIEGRPAQEES